ncbi:hypothetical protein COB72_03435 [bacterium]|nr:MAG: hypothetical protein COB72_03435 [bacterium]
MINTANFVGAVTPDVLSAVARVQSANENPIYAMILGANQVRNAVANEVKWFTDAPSSGRSQINNSGVAYGAGTTTLVVDDASVYMPGDQIISEDTGEAMLITSLNTSSNTLVVFRSIGSIAASNLSVQNNVYLMRVGHASGEGAGSPGHSSAGKTPAHNFLQTFREVIELSGKTQRIETITEDERGYQRRKKFEKLTGDIERTIVFGSRNANAGVDAAGNPVSTMGGLREAITTHVHNVAGSLTSPLFLAFAEAGFDTGSSVKDLYAGPTLINAIHGLYSSQQRITTQVANVGLRIQTIDTPNGQIRLIPHKKFRGAFAGDGIMVDGGELWLRPTGKNGGGKLQLKENTQAPGVDGVRDELFAEHTIDWGAEQNHAQIRGVTP